MSQPQHDCWPRLSPQQVPSLSEEWLLLLRQHEEEMIAGNKMQLDDICRNCDNKAQFAKTYRALRRDLREQLAKMQAKIDDCQSDQSPESLQAVAFMKAMMHSTKAIISCKLRCMAQQFQVCWGEPIENWAGKEGALVDKAGCALVVLAIFGPVLLSVSKLALALRF